MTKDQWIQKARALLFDLQFCLECGMGPIRKEIDEILAEGGGYDTATETSKTQLRWTSSVHKDGV